MNARAEELVEAKGSPITEYNRTEAALADLRARFATTVFDVSTTKGLDGAKEARKEIRTYRTDLEKKRVELKAPALERSRLIDAEAKRITAELAALEDPIDAQIKAEEGRKEEEKAAKIRAEQDRVTKHRTRIETMRQWPTIDYRMTAAQVRAKLDFAIAFDLDIESFEEFSGEAANVYAHAVEELHKATEIWERREADEAKAAADRAENERLRKEIAERAAAEEKRIQEAFDAAKKERDDADAKARAEREEADRVAAEERERLEKDIRDRQEELDRQYAETAERLGARLIDAAPSVTASPDWATAVDTINASPERPSDDEIVAALSAYFKASEMTVRAWLFDFQHFFV